MNLDEERNRLVQKHNLDWIRRKLKATDMVTVSRCNHGNFRGDYFIFVD